MSGPWVECGKKKIVCVHEFMRVLKEEGSQDVKEFAQDHQWQPWLSYAYTNTEKKESGPEKWGE